MIIVKFTSGLGNQMFQYAFYRMLQERYYETEIKADMTWFHANDEHQGYELERIFKGVKDSTFWLEKATTKEIRNVTGIIPCFVSGKYGPLFEKLVYYPNRVLRLFSEKNYAPYKIDELRECFGVDTDQEQMNRLIKKLYQKVMHLDITKNWYLAGFWTEEMYYKERLEEGLLQKEFIFPKLTGYNAELAKDICSKNAISIHVRRGDYVGKYASDFIALGRDYYEKAISYIEERIAQPTYYIFSDDSVFVEQEFSWLSDKVIVSHNVGSESYRDMQLMTLCRHNIIANSTFSQWGAFLNQNEGHITVYPRAYMRTKDNEIKSLTNWVML